MAAPAWEGALRSVRRAVLLGEGQGPTDGQLVRAYVARREEAAFAELVRRHGPMVWGVCRRLLPNTQDVEDAFQATFLVLVRKAPDLQPPEMVGNWLHGVACRTARRAKVAFAKRQAREKALSRPEAVEVARDQALAFLLDQELERLPEKYRAPVVLCYLEGKTRKEAARQLGWPEGTVAGRLARARALLARRLARHGLAVVGGALALARTASANVPRRLVLATLQGSAHFALGNTAGGIPANVLALTKGVLQGMLLKRLAWACGWVSVFLVGLACTAAGVLPARHLAAEEPAPTPAVQRPGSGAPRAGKTQDTTDPGLQGIWSLAQVESDGKRLSVEQGSVILVVTNRFMIWKERNEDRAFVYKVAPDKAPKHIDLTSLAEGQARGKTRRGVYRIQGDRLLICESARARPKDTTARERNEATLYIYHRVAALSHRDAPAPPPRRLAPPPESTATWANKMFQATGPTRHDFGEVPAVARRAHRFHLRNIYAAPLEITSVRTSAGCVTAVPSTRRLQPNEAGSIDVTVDARRFRGRKTVAVYVTFGSNYVSTATLWVTADSRADLPLLPAPHPPREGNPQD